MLLKYIYIVGLYGPHVATECFFLSDPVEFLDAESLFRGVTDSTIASTGTAGTAAGTTVSTHK